MTFVGYIEEENGIHYVYSFVEHKWSVSEFSSSGLAKQKMIEMKATAMIILFEQFLVTDITIEDVGKNVVSYRELRKRLQDYVVWGLDNQGVSPQKVVENGFKMKAVMLQMIKMISQKHTDRGKLKFLYFNVTKLYEEPYNY